MNSPASLPTLSSARTGTVSHSYRLNRNAGLSPIQALKEAKEGVRLYTAIWRAALSGPARAR